MTSNYEYISLVLHLSSSLPQKIFDGIMEDLNS